MGGRQRQRGFTLIELMTVVAIIGIFAAVAFGISNLTYGARPENVADQVASQFQVARMRAISTKRTHRITVLPSQILLEQGTTFGMAAPPAFQAVQTMTLPNNIVIWAAQTGAAVSPTGTNPAQNTGLNLPTGLQIIIKPDGGVFVNNVRSGVTVFITDALKQSEKYRVLLYSITGSSYARETW